MGSIFVVMPRAEDASHLAASIQSFGLMFETEICSTGAEVLRLSHDRDGGVVICTRNLRDMNYAELADYLPEGFGIIVLTKDAGLESVSNRVVKLLMPFRRGDLVSTIEMMTAGLFRRRKKKDTGPRKRSEEEKQIIDKAKQVLMDRNGMMEAEAFRYIQKNSMDYSRSMVESAQMILAMNSM